jgi:general secretion pathway protein A
MYTAFHNLKKKPFSMTADPAFLFVTEQHREALVGLTYAVLDRKGFLVLSGMAGSGKTTLLGWVLQRLSRDSLRSSVILNPTLTRDEFLESVMLDFGITEIPASKAQRLWILQRFLLEGAKQGNINVLMIDEAHKLSYELLEEIRFLGNLECGEEKLLQILLFGQSELDDILNRPELWQLKQRISVRLTIGRLAPNEVPAYIQHRWSVAGGHSHPFTQEAIERIERYSRGIPRIINAICDSSLMQAFADESRSVTAEHVDAAAEDLRFLVKSAEPSLSLAEAAAAVRTTRASQPAPAPRVKPISVPTFTTLGERPRPVVPVNGTGDAAAPDRKPVASEPAPPPTRPRLFRWAGKLRLNGNHKA